MLELLIVFVFIWLFWKAIKLTFKVTWGAVKLIAWLLFIVAVPMLIGMLILAGGLLLLIPLALMAIAFGLLRSHH